MALSYFLNLTYGIGGLAMASNITYFAALLGLIVFTIVSKDEQMQSCFPQFNFSANFGKSGTFIWLGAINLVWSLNDYWGVLSMNLFMGVLGADY
jgi:hypothetical protein